MVQYVDEIHGMNRMIESAEQPIFGKTELLQSGAYQRSKRISRRSVGADAYDENFPHGGNFG